MGPKSVQIDAWEGEGGISHSLAHSLRSAPFRRAPFCSAMFRSALLQNTMGPKRSNPRNGEKK